MAVTSPTRHKAASGNGTTADGSPAQSGTKGFPKNYPAAPQLSTPTDLTPEQAKAVTEAVNPLIADSFALYVKTKNFHWHLSGSHFRDYHLLFDEHADQIFAGIDPMAERIRKIGGATVRSISHVGSLQTLHDDNDEFVAPAEMIQRLMQDNRHVAQQLRAAAETAEDNKDIATSDLLEALLDEAERRTWFLFEIAQGADNAL